MITVRLIKELNKGEWYISYTALAPCGCRLNRYKLKLFKKTEPTQKQIENAINNKRES